MQPPTKEVHEYHREKEERKKKENPRPKNTETSVSKSKLAAGVYEGIRKAHSEEEKSRARHLRKLEREGMEGQKLREQANRCWSLFNTNNENPPCTTLATQNLIFSGIFGIVFL